jgi:hypothetical protein
VFGMGSINSRLRLFRPENDDKYVIVSSVTTLLVMRLVHTHGTIEKFSLRTLNRNDVDRLKCGSNIKSNFEFINSRSSSRGVSAESLTKSRFEIGKEFVGDDSPQYVTSRIFSCGLFAMAVAI